MDTLRAFVVVVAVVAAGASATAPKPHEVTREATVDGSADRAWTALVRVFAENSWPIQDMDKGSGLIATDWMQLDEKDGFADCGSGGAGSTAFQSQIRFNVLVTAIDADSSKVMVNAKMRQDRLDTIGKRHSFMDCTSTGKVEYMIRDQVNATLRANPAPTPVDAAPPSAPVVDAAPAAP